MDCLLVLCHLAFPSFLMFSLGSSQSDVSPAFIASSIIQKAFDRHTDGDVSEHAKPGRPGLSGGVHGSFPAFIRLKTFDIACEQLVAGCIFRTADHTHTRGKSNVAPSSSVTASCIHPFEASACLLGQGCSLWSTLTLIPCFICCLCVCGAPPVHTRAFVLPCFGFRDPPGRGGGGAGR